MRDGAPRVLVVDDDEIVLDAVKASLSECVVTITQSPSEALVLLEEQHHDILLADLMMNGMNGIDLIRAAKKISPSLESMVMTGCGRKEDVIQALKEGASDFLEKPISPDFLRRAVDRAWSMQQMRRRSCDLLDELRKANAELRVAKEGAEESDRAKTQLLANTSHEIRTPMNAVVGMTSLLLETELDSKQHQYLEVVRRSGDLLLNIINDLLDLSKIEAGKLAFDNINFNLTATIEETIELFADRAATKLLALDCEVDDDVPKSLNGDPSRLRQVLSNLVGNAVKFTEQGSITVRVRRGADYQPAAPRLRFEVQDSGIGLPEDRQQQVFDSFRTTHPDGGTGLGLAIAKQLVELMGGDIGVQSQVGEGSTFWFTATFACPEEEPLGLTGPVPLLSGLHALVIDGDQRRPSVKRQLEEWGVDVEEAADAGTARKLLVAAAAGGAPLGLLLVSSDLASDQQVAEFLVEPTTAEVPLLLLSDGESVALDAKINVSAHATMPCGATVLYSSVMKAILSPRSMVRPEPVESTENGDNPVLLVEDNAINQEVVLSMLETLGYGADVANNGLEALELLQQSSYKVVFMDCAMPEMDGYEAAAEIRIREGSRRRTPIIAMTACTMLSDRERCFAAGMDAFLAKPIMIADLRVLLETLVPKHLKRGTGSTPSNTGN